MKKYKNVFSCVVLGIVSLIIGYTIWIPGDKANEKTNPIAIMLEQDDGSYKMSSSNNLFQTGYAYNSSLSSCINGSVITPTGGGVSIALTGNDRCTLYYDQRASDFNITGITVNGSSTSTFPIAMSYTVATNCNGATATWNYANWGLDISAVTSASASCSLAFTSKTSPTYLNTYVKDQSVGTCSNTSYNTASTCESNGGTWTTATTAGKCTDTTYTTQSTCETAKKSWYNVMNENGYRYEGSNPNNYVLFNNELWRIIGVFDTDTEVVKGGGTFETQSLTKIIRNESIGSYAFHSSNYNYWVNTSGTRSSLNILLNDFYYNASSKGTSNTACKFYSTTVGRNCDYSKIGLQSTYRSMVENVKWYLGGYSSATYVNDMYNYERSTTKPSANAATSTGYVGLMYPSDYGYSVLASSCARNTYQLGSYSNASCAGKAWLLQNGYEWTITPDSSSAYSVWRVNINGSVSNYNAYYGYAARPVLYLKSSTYIVSGDGTMSNPYIINGE